jgi:hypothetical protein
MKKNKFVLGVSVLALALIVTGVSSCISLLSGATVKTSQVVKAAPAGTFAGKNVVMLDVVLAPRYWPNSADQGFIANQLIINNFKKKGDAFTEELNSIAAKKLPETTQAFIDAYKQTYSTEMVRASFDFGGKAPERTFFSKPDKDTVSKISQICQSNGADYVVTVIQEIVYGTVSSVRQAAVTVIENHVVVLDKDGKLVAHVRGFMPNDSKDINRGGTGYIVNPDNPAQHEGLFDTGRGNLLELVPLLSAVK